MFIVEYLRNPDKNVATVVSHGVLLSAKLAPLILSA
jgi:hypothetical protein